MTARGTASAVDGALLLLGAPPAPAGADPKVEAVKNACASPAFQRAFSEAAARAGDAVKSMRDVQYLAHAVLDELQVDHQGVFLTFSWDPATRGLGIYFRPICPAPSAAAAAAEQAHP